MRDNRFFVRSTDVSGYTPARVDGRVAIDDAGLDELVTIIPVARPEGATS